jgi:anti-anti-sigma factor
MARAVRTGPRREFVVRADSLDRAPGVLLRGELDIDTAPRLTNLLDSEIRATVGPFVVDLCDLDFLDSSGVSVLVRARALLGREDRELIVICPPGPSQRIFELTNLTELLVLFDSREEAATFLSAAGWRPTRSGARSAVRTAT